MPGIYEGEFSLHYTSQGRPFAPCSQSEQPIDIPLLSPFTSCAAAECENSKQCAPAKHHFDECTNRVNEGNGFKGEDCMEEL